MNDLTQLEMTLDEARETDRLIKRHINTTRYLLLDMRDRKGWKALGYESFKDYGEKELGYKETRIYQLVDAAEIGLQLGYDSTIVESIPKESQLRPLKSVPEEVRKAIWEEATAKAEEEHAKLTAQRVESAVKEWQQRSKDWHHQYIDERDKRRQVEFELSETFKRAQELEIPADYETAKAEAARLQAELANLKQEQDRLVNAQLKAKLNERARELEEMEQRKTIMEEQVERMKNYLASLEGEARRIEVHQKVIEENRLHLISLAAFLSDEEPIEDDPTRKRWRALADMLAEAMTAVRQYSGDHRPELTVIRGDAA